MHCQSREILSRVTRAARLAAVLFLLSPCGYAQTPNPTPQSEESRTGTISGRIVNESGQPLVGAAVFLRTATPSNFTRTTTANNDGHFQINGLDPGLYSISANAPAFVALPTETDVQLPVYRVGDSVRLELVRGGVITGTVTNAANEPVVGSRVRAFRVRDQNGKPARGATAYGERMTDDRGVYRIYGLVPGTYLVQAGGPGSLSTSSTPDFDAPTFAPSTTRDAATEVLVRSGEEVTVDIRHRGEPGHVVSGTVRSSGPTGANVMLTLVGDVSLVTNGSYQTVGGRGFAMYGVADGDYEIVAQEVLSQTNQSFPDLAFSEPMRISVRGADVTGLELVPKPLSTIAGKIQLETSKLPECQNKRQPAFNETLISLVQNRSSDVDLLAPLRMFIGTAGPDRDGSFTFRNLRPGQYSYSPRFFARYWYLRSITLSGPTLSAITGNKSPALSKDAAKNWTVLKSGERLTGLTITLSEGAASIRGKVEKPEDMRIEIDTRVYLVPAERDKADDPLRYFVSELAADGTFSFTNLPPGKYLTLARSLPNTPQTTDKLQLPDSLEVRNRIRRAAELVKTEVELKPCQNLTEYKQPIK